MIIEPAPPPPASTADAATSSSQAVRHWASRTNVLCHQPGSAPQPQHQFRFNYINLCRLRRQSAERIPRGSLRQKARAICGSSSAESAHSEDSDTPMRRTRFGMGN